MVVPEGRGREDTSSRGSASDRGTCHAGIEPRVSYRRPNARLLAGAAERQAVYHSAEKVRQIGRPDQVTSYLERSNLVLRDAEPTFYPADQRVQQEGGRITPTRSPFLPCTTTTAASPEAYQAA